MNISACPQVTFEGIVELVRQWLWKENPPKCENIKLKLRVEMVDVNDSQRTALVNKLANSFEKLRKQKNDAITMRKWLCFHGDKFDFHFPKTARRFRIIISS